MPYRPFITCNDPRGVIESSTHIKSKDLEVKRLKKKKIQKSAIDGLDSSEEPSTSSSKSSAVHSTNLISRLMGRKVLNQHKPQFDQSKSSRKRRTFDQMIEALKFRGSVLNGVDSSPNPDLSNSNHWLSLVLMKPSRFSCLNLDNPIVPQPRSEVGQEIMLHKMRVRTNPLAEAFLNEDREMESGGRRKRIPKSDEEVTEKAISPLNAKQVYEDPSQIEITDYVDDDQSSSNETPLSFSNWSSNNNNNSNSNTSLIYPNEEDEEEEAIECLSSSPSIVSSRKISTNENRLKKLLLSSPSFVNRVEEYFDLDLNANLDKESYAEQNDLNSKILVDLANELIELHSYDCSRVRKTSSVNRCYTSLDQILDQVCEEIESYGCYVKDGQSTDNLLLLVKEDFKGTRMANGVWDIGWRNLGSGDEIEEITKGVDQIILDGLIQEVLVDLTI